MNRTVAVIAALPFFACGGAQSADVDPESLPIECAPYIDELSDDAPAYVRSERLAVAQMDPILITNAVILTAAGQRYEPGYIYFEAGFIEAIGEGEYTAAEGAQVIDAGGRFVTPGVIDTHSHLGVYPTPYVSAHSDGNEATSPLTTSVEAVHSIWPQDPGFQRAVAGGVTTLHVLPGSANLAGGRGFTMRPHRGALNAEELRFPGAPDSLKMACGENPKRVYGSRGSMPSTRMGSIATMRQAWTDVIEYMQSGDDHAESMRRWCEDGAEPEERPGPRSLDLGHETMAAVIRGEILPQIHCYRADEMLTQIQLAHEFGYEIRSFHHAVEAYKIRDVLAEENIATSTWADWWGFKIEAYDAIYENAGLLTEAGAIAVIHSDSAIGIQRLNQEAAKAWYTALERGIEITEDQALQWFTLNAAWTLGVEDVTGSLEVGKMADIVVWSDYPFSVYASADLVFVEGVLEWDRDNPGEPWSDFEAGQWNQGGAR